MALDFSLTSPTTALGAGTPSRALSLTLTGSGTLGSTASFALSDGSAGGSFFPASPVTIASGQTVGAVTQFIYTPSPTASGAITLTVTSTGGLSASHALVMPITANATVVIRDAFVGTAGTDLTAHTPDVGGAWLHTAASGGTEALQLDGAGFFNGIGTGHIFAEYVNATVMPQNEYDVSCSIRPLDVTSQVYGGLLAGVGSNSPSALEGYRYFCDNVGSSWGVISYNVGTSVLGGTSPAITIGTTYQMLLALRVINGQQYVCGLVNGQHLTGSPAQNSEHVGGYVGFLPEIAAGVTGTSSNGVRQGSFVASLPDWSGAAPSLGVSPSSASATDAASTVAITATRTGGTGALVASVTGGGTISTTAPTSGTPFTYTPPSTGTGTATVSVTDPTDGLTTPVTCVISFAPAPPGSLTLSGPTSGLNGAASTNFTVTPNALGAGDTITPAATGGGTFSPTSLTFASGSPAAQTFTYTPSASGAHSISITDNNGATINGSPITYTSSVPSAGTITLTGPTSGTTGAASTSFTVSPASLLASDVVTPHATGGGSFSPATLTFASGNPAAQTFTYTPGASGAHDITITDANGATISGSPITYTASAASPGTLALTGPTSGTTSTPSANFTVTPGSLLASDVVTPVATGGGTFSPATLTFASGNPSPQTFTYTPASSGGHSISITDANGATISGSPITYTASAGPVYPNPNQVLLGVVFGPTGNLTGTLTSGSGSGSYAFSS